MKIVKRPKNKLAMDKFIRAQAALITDPELRDRTLAHLDNWRCK